jgi:pyridoxamine 5'-phosphate oxidase
MAVTRIPNVKDPFDLFEQWLADAVENEINDPDAASLATCDATGQPSNRMVLVRGFDARGFVFYTNLGSRKSGELTENPKAALCLHWKSLRRQVRICGTVTPVAEAEADAYYKSRARDSRIGAWASKQSQPLENDWALEKRVAKYAAKYAIGHVPRPDFWSGFRVVPHEIEFWLDGAFRLHDRLQFTRETPDHPWHIVRLYP